MRQSPILERQLSHEKLENRRFRRKIKRYSKNVSPEDKVPYNEGQLKARTLIMSARIRTSENEFEGSSKNPPTFSPGFHVMF